MGVKSKTAGVCALAAILSGCASFDGVPEPVVAPDIAAQLANGQDYGPQAAMAFSRANTDEKVLKPYRDAFIAIQIAAIDARYMDFRAKLSREMKGANFGFDLAVLGLTSAGSIAAERTANILSAGAAGLTGSKAALSKEVYFEKTLPALIASMDARRLRQKAIIVEKMRTKSTADYGIAEALVDLAAYQQAASLDGAIEQVTNQAATDKQEAQQQYDDITETCTPETGVGDQWARIRKGLNALKPDTDKPLLDSVSDQVGTPKLDDFDKQKGAILAKLVTDYCSVSSAEALVNKLKLNTKVPFE